ncbi:MAG: molybdate transport system substrate-binding protein [Candidatus Azotimanducaceae bacterium]|jgi:molybdate transport system substrate-binding protein
MLHTQITQGAPFDIFLSADEIRPVSLESRLKTISFIYARGRLVFWHNNAATVNEESFTNYNGKIAIANPKLAPYGYAAKEFLTKYKPSLLKANRLIRGNNVNQSYQFIRSRNVNAGFVSLTQMILGNHANYWLIPPDRYPPIIQRGILINSQEPNATEFANFLLSDNAQAIIRKSGYDRSEPNNDDSKLEISD